MPTHWQREVLWQRRVRRAEGESPYLETRKWRRRAIAAWVLNAILLLALWLAAASLRN